MNISIQSIVYADIIEDVCFMAKNEFVLLSFQSYVLSRPTMPVVYLCGYTILYITSTKTGLVTNAVWDWGLHSSVVPPPPVFFPRNPPHFIPIGK